VLNTGECYENNDLWYFKAAAAQGMGSGQAEQVWQEIVEQAVGLGEPVPYDEDFNPPPPVSFFSWLVGS
jgi:hypothetical protein